MKLFLLWLFRFCAEHRLEKKYLIVPSYQTGHQIGEALAKEGGSWINLHFVTLPSLAQETAGIELSAQGNKLVSQANALFLVDRVFRRLKLPKKDTRLGDSGNTIWKFWGHDPNSREFGPVPEFQESGLYFTSINRWVGVD